jgi:hypothetical protein
MNNLWKNVTKEDVIKAIEIFDSSHETYPEPRNTFLIYNNKKYPAKHVRGMAYKVANKREISKNDYSGGQETADFLRKLGFTVEYKKGTLKPQSFSETPTNEPEIKKISNQRSSRRFKELFQRIVHFFRKLSFTLEQKKRTIEPQSISETPTNEPEIKKLNKQRSSRRLNVVSQKNALQLLLQKHYGHIETEKKFDWMKTPNIQSLPEEYKEIVSALSKYRNQTGFQKSHYQLLCDIVLYDQKVIIEYDEYQHFSEARKITLENYSANIQLNFPKEKWIEACEKMNRKDNFPIDRDERRAYFDTVRDIEAFKHGYKLIRIKHGDFDWEMEGAENQLSQLITGRRINNNMQLRKHKIARLIVTGKDYDVDGNPYYPKINMLLENFITKVYGKQKFEFIITAGGFLTFKFPANLRYGINIPYAEKYQIPIFQNEANNIIKDFFAQFSNDSFQKLKEIDDYFTIGIDGYNPINKQKIELVGVYDLKKENVIRWTGKFYPTEQQRNDLIKIIDLNSHFVELNNQKIVILGCHDLNVYSPRGQAAALPEGWKKKTAQKFKELCYAFNPDIILQHPHTTDTPNIWNAAWRTLEKELPNVRHFASGINYSNKRGGVRAELREVLLKTKKGDVIDFYL